MGNSAMELNTGLVSITFRDKTPQEVVSLVAEAGLDGIEWGGDVHAPHGDLAKAREIRGMCGDSGIAIPSYGSYYRAGVSEADGLSFQSVLDSAGELGAETIRIWAGKASGGLAADERNAIVYDILRVAKLAGDVGLSVSLEFHSGTLTDTDESVSTLLNELGVVENVFLYWQPRVGATVEEALKSMSLVFPRLGNLHVFHWLVDATGALDQRPFTEGEGEWARYFSAVASSENKPRISRFAMLEFVRGGASEQFLEDAATLRRLL